VNGAVLAGGGCWWLPGSESGDRAFRTVSGGVYNGAGDLDTDPLTGMWATVGGGRQNSVRAHL
jgi:hypothetical protein